MKTSRPLYQTDDRTSWDLFKKAAAVTAGVVVTLAVLYVLALFLAEVMALSTS